MIWALLAILGVPIWLIVGILLGIWLSRRAFKQQPGVFELVVRSSGDTKWPRGANSGRIVSDVLIINRGPALLRAQVGVIAAVSELDIGEGPKRPESATARRVTFDDGSSCDVAVAPVIAARLEDAAALHQTRRAGPA